MNRGIIKLCLYLWQETILSENFLQDGGLRPHTVHFNVVIGRHVSLDNHDQSPESIFLIEHFAQAEDQEVKTLDVSNGRITPDVCFDNPGDGLLDLISVEVVVWECATDIPAILLKHLVRIVRQLARLQRVVQRLVILLAVTLLIHVDTSAEVPELSSKICWHTLSDNFTEGLTFFIVQKDSIVHHFTNTAFVFCLFHSYLIWFCAQVNRQLFAF